MPTQAQLDEAAGLNLPVGGQGAPPPPSPAPAPLPDAAPAGSPAQVNAALTGGSTDNQSTPITITERPADQAPPTPPSVAAQGKDLLPKMDWAVKQQESGNQQLDKDGKIKTSSKGALGISQLMPETAKGLGVNPYNETENAEGGRRLLGKLYDKYQNWTDALVAYNAGEGKADEWIAAGRPDSGKGALSSETRQYVPAVLANLGMSPGTAFVQNKDKPTEQDFQSEYQEAMHEQGNTEQDMGETGFSLPDAEGGAGFSALLNDDGTPSALSKGFGDAVSATMAGAFEGIRDIAAGPIQAGLDATDPSAAAGFTNFINMHLTPFKQQSEDHPVAHFTGQIIGTGVGILGAARLLGPLAAPIVGMSKTAQAIELAIRGLPAVAKAAGVGGALGLTAFNSDPDNASRLGEGALGAILGPVGLGLAKILATGIQKASNQQEISTFLSTLKQRYAGFEPALSAVKATFQKSYEDATKLRDARYSLRDSAGRLIEGYPTGLEEGGGIAAQVAAAMKGNVGRDQSSAQTKAAATELDRVLGLTQQRNEQQAARRAQEAYEREYGSWEASLNRGKTRISDLTPSIVDRLVETGQLPNRPLPPPPFVSRPIKPEQMAEGRRVIERARRSAKRNTAARTQLGILKRSLDDVASQTAKEAGVDVTTYERMQTLADKFNRDVVAPMQKIAGGRTAAEFARETTPAEMYNQAVKVIESTDRDAQRKFYQLLGPNGREQVSKVAFNEMLTRAETDLKGTIAPKAISAYIQKHRIGLEEVLGRDEYDKLVGVGKIAEDLTGELKQKGYNFVVHHPWIMYAAGREALEGRISESARLFGATGLVHIAATAFHRLQASKRLGVIFMRASRAKPGSPEMQKLIHSVDAAMNASARVASRIAPQETGGEPLNTLGGITYQVIGGVTGLTDQ